MTKEEQEDLEWNKAVGLFRMAINQILEPLKLYGQNLYVESASEEIVSLALQLHHKLEGIDEPYHINFDKLHHWG